MGYDIHVTEGPWLAQPGQGAEKRFTFRLKKWDNVALQYVSWSSESVTAKCYQVANLSSTSTSNQVNFYSSDSDVSSLSFGGGGTELVLVTLACKDLAPTTGYFCFFQFTAVGYTAGNSHGIAVDSSFSISWPTVPTAAYLGLMDTSGVWTVQVNTSHGLSLTGMSNQSISNDPQITVDSPSGLGLNSGGGTQTLTDGAYTFPSSITTATGGSGSLRGMWNGTAEATAARPAAVTSATIPVIGYAVSASDTGHRLPLDTGRHIVSTIANGQAPSTVVVCPSVTLKTLLNDRNTTAIATEGLSFSFGLNEAGTVTYGFLRSVKVKWAITTFTYGGTRFKIDSSTDGSAWTNRASTIVPSESGTMTVDIGTMTGANYFRFYFDDGGTAATITFTYIVPIGIQPGSPIDIVDASTSLPPTSEEVYSIPSPPQTFDGAVDTYRDFKILNRHPTAAYTVELVNLSTGYAGAADAALDFTNLTFQNTSNVAISPQITVAAASSQTVRARYTLASGNPLDGAHIGRIGARIVRTAFADVRIFLANGSTDDIWAYDLNGVRQEVYTGSGITPAGVAVDPYTGELYLLHAATGTTVTVSVWKLGSTAAPDRTLTITGGGISSDTWTTIAAWNGYLYVGGSGTAGKIVVAGTKGTSTPYVGVLTLSSGSAGDKHMAVSPEGYLWVNVGGAARTVDQWNLWSNALVRTLNPGSQVSANITGLMYDHRNREISTAQQSSPPITWQRYNADTGSLVQQKQKASDSTVVGSGVAVPIADREYHAYSTTALLWTSLKSHSGYSTIALGTSLVGSAPFQLAWLY